MFGLGFFELAIFGVIALIVLGPDKLPHAARQLGKWYALIVHTKNKLTHEMAVELQLLETQAQIKSELAKLRATESVIKEELAKLQGAVEQNREQILAELSPHAPTPKEPSTDSWVKDWISTHTDDPATDQLPTTKPMTGRFFLLGDYDKRRRLPPAPRLPNYQADRLQLTSAND